MKPTFTNPPKYPLGTIAAYGPDNKVATKLAIAVFKRPDQRKPDEMKRLYSEEGDVRNVPSVIDEVAAFFKQHGVKHTVSSDRIIGCPHEEGVDYPAGETCPQCPFWKDIDRFTHEPKGAAVARKTAELEGGEAPKTAKVGRNDPCPCGSGKKYKKCCGA